MDTWRKISSRKYTERHTAHTIVSWPNRKQWVTVHTSDLMMIIRQSIYILSIMIFYQKCCSIRHPMQMYQNTHTCLNSPLWTISTHSMSSKMYTNFCCALFGCEYIMSSWRSHRTHPLQWRHNECNGVSSHQRLDCLLNVYSGADTKKIAKLRVTGFCDRWIPLTEVQ